MRHLLTIEKVEFVLAREGICAVKSDIKIFKEKEVIPWEWKLLEDSRSDEEMSLMVFQNGVYFLDQKDLIACLEIINAEEVKDLAIQGVVHKYLNGFHEETFQAFGINIEGYITFPDQEMAKSQLLKEFFASEAQHESDQQLIQAVINFIYKLERGVLTMTVRNTEIAVSEQESVSIIKVSANFHHDLLRFPQEDRLQHLHRLVDTWDADLKLYKEIIDCKFLEVKELQFNHL